MDTCVTCSFARVQMPSCQLLDGKTKKVAIAKNTQQMTLTTISSSNDAPTVASVTPLPKLHVLLAILMTLAEAMSHNSFATLVAFQVRFYKISKREEDEAFYAGILLAVFPLTQTLTSSLWGIVSDKIGRKAVICISLFVNAATLGGLAFTTNYYVDLVLRALQGFFDSILASTRSYLHDVTDDTNDANAYTLCYHFNNNDRWTMSSRWAAIISGLLSSPASKYKIFKSSKFLNMFPFCVVGFIASLINALTLVLCLFLLNTNKQQHDYDEEELGHDDVPMKQKDSAEPLLKKEEPKWYTYFTHTLLPVFANPLFIKAMVFTFLCNLLFEYAIIAQLTWFHRTFSVMVRLWLAQSRLAHGMGWSSSVIGITLSASCLVPC